MTQAPDPSSDPVEGTPLIAPSSVDHPLHEQIVEACRSVYDPEIPVNVVDLGLIYDCQIQNGTEDGNHVYIKMTLTAAGCGMGPVITNDRLVYTSDAADERSSVDLGGRRIIKNKTPPPETGRFQNIHNRNQI